MINMMEYKTERLTDINRQLEKCHNECNAVLAQAEMKLKNGKNLTPFELDTVILAINEMSSKGDALLNGIMAYLQKRQLKAALIHAYKCSCLVEEVRLLTASFTKS